MTDRPTTTMPRLEGSVVVTVGLAENARGSAARRVSTSCITASLTRATMATSAAASGSAFTHLSRSAS